MGYIYAMSNKTMPGILKIGMTERSIEERLKEANGTFTLIPFVVEMSKNVLNCKEKEKYIHQILQSKRVTSNREFFEVTLEEIKPIFNLMDSVESSNFIDTKNVKCKENEIVSLQLDNDIPENFFEIMNEINEIYYGYNNHILIIHDKKEFCYNGVYSKNLKYIINLIDNKIPHSDEIKNILLNNLIKTNNNELLKFHFIKDMFVNSIESLFGVGAKIPYTEMYHFLKKLFPTRIRIDGCIGLDIAEYYSEKKNEESILLHCFIKNENDNKILLFDYINSKK